MFSNDISIDLGTATVLIYIKGKGIVLREPSVIAVNTDTNKVCAVGEEAFEMLGKTPDNIKVVKPLTDGVISSCTLTQEMIKIFLSRVMKNMFVHPRIMMCVPSGITNVEQRAVIEAAREVGAKEIYIIEEPVAAALGAGRDISKPRGTMVIDIGGGTTDIAVVALGGIVVSRSLKIAGDEFDEAVIRYVRKTHNLNIGPKTAERIKHEIGCVLPREKEIITQVKGISTITGMPEQIVLSSQDIYGAFDDFVFNITERVKEVLEETPPELHGDIIEDGILMTGGGSLIYGLAERISKAVGVKTILADNIVECVTIGAGIALDTIDGVKDPMHIYHKRAYIHD